MHYTNPIMKQELKDRIDTCIYELKYSGCCLLQFPFLTADLVDQALVEYIQLNAATEVVPSSARLSLNTINHSPAAKYAIGDTNGRGDEIPQLLKSLYMPLNPTSTFIRQYPTLSSLNSFLIYVRNQISDLEDCFGESLTKYRFWNASRIHHYPSGGGFMAQHVDTAFPSIMADAKLPFLQVSLPLTARGRDFFEGGGWVVRRKTLDRYYTDRHYRDNPAVTLFDGSVLHGVSTVDPQMNLDFSGNHFRAALFASLYPVPIDYVKEYSHQS